MVWTKGKGTIEMEWALPDGTSNAVDLKDVLHVPDLSYSLFSISQATRKGFEITFVDEDCHIRKDSILTGSASKVQNTYILSLLESTTKVAGIIQQNIKALSTSLILNEDAVEL